MLPSLRAVQLLTAGYDDVLPLLPPGVTLANAAGVHDASTAELAVGLALAALRGVPDMVRAQDRARWVPLGGRPALADKRVLILGYGSIGRAVARRLTGFEVTLTAVASRARAGDDLVPRVHGIDELPELLPHHDVVVVIVPLSAATTGLVGREFLARPAGRRAGGQRGARQGRRHGRPRRGDRHRPDHGGAGRHRPRAAAGRPPAVAQPGCAGQPARGG